MKPLQVGRLYTADEHDILVPALQRQADAAGDRGCMEEIRCTAQHHSARSAVAFAMAGLVAACGGAMGLRRWLPLSSRRPHRQGARTRFSAGLQSLAGGDRIERMRGRAHRAVP